MLDLHAIYDIFLIRDHLRSTYLIQKGFYIAYIARDDFCNTILPEQRYDPHIHSKAVSFHLYDYTSTCTVV